MSFVLSVFNEGEPIPEAIQAKIFEPFWRRAIDLTAKVGTRLEHLRTDRACSQRDVVGDVYERERYDLYCPFYRCGPPPDESAAAMPRVRGYCRRATFTGSGGGHACISSGRDWGPAADAAKARRHSHEQMTAVGFLVVQSSRIRVAAEPKVFSGSAPIFVADVALAHITGRTSICSGGT